MNKKILNLIKLNGRYSLKDDNLHFYNVYSGISFMCSSDVSLIISFLEKPGYIYIIKNRDFSKKEKVYLEKETTINIAASNKLTRIDILKANEALDNELVIKDIKCKSLQLPKAGEKKIKVYGDSTVCGFGMLSHDGDASIHTSDGVLDFVCRAIYELNFDGDILAASGWGLTFSHWTNPKTIGIEKYTDFVKVNSDIKWKSKIKPDLLIISLGTNDHSYIENDSINREESINYFIKSYEKLLKKELKNNPELPVLMLYGSLDEKDVFEFQEKTFYYLKNKFNNIHQLKLDGDNSGISNHSFVTYHSKMSEQLKNKIQQLLLK